MADPRPGSLSSRLDEAASVLVIEDEPDIAEFLGAFFRASGLGLVHVNPRSPEEAAAAVVEHEPACVLLDVFLAGFSGLDALARIRATPGGADLGVIVVTADPAPATAERARELGVIDVVPKPFSVKELFAKVSEVVEGVPRPSAPSSALSQRLEAAARAGRRGAGTDSSDDWPC